MIRGGKNQHQLYTENRGNEFKFIVRLAATGRKTTVELISTEFRSPGTGCCNIVFMFTLPYVTACYVWLACVL